MTNALRDQNNTPTLIAASSDDGQTIIRIKVNASNRLNTSDGNTGTDHGTKNAKIDENNVHCLMAVSSIDGKTPVAVYSDSNGNLLTQST